MTSIFQSRFIRWTERFFYQYEVGGGKSRIVPMEGLRGLAVLLVFFVHFYALFAHNLRGGSWLHGVFHFLGVIGNTGVDLFFVMSGYLIYGALIRREVGYGKFTRRRVERIYPTFLVVFVIYLILSALFPMENKIHGSFLTAGRYVLANLFLLPGIFAIKPIVTVAWSLSYEFLFYLTIPLLIGAARMRRWKCEYRLAAFVFLWILIGVMLLLQANDNRSRMITFVVGIILFEVVNESKGGWLLHRVGEFCTIAMVLATWWFYYHVRVVRPQSLVVPLFSLCLLSAAFFFFSFYSFQFDGPLQTVFSWAPIRYLGNMSYSYYLIHGLTLEGLAIVFVALRLPTSSPLIVLLALLVGFAATWVTSSALFFLVERKYSLKPSQKFTEIHSAPEASASSSRATAEANLVQDSVR
ncbi:MAG: acyltransferase [Candidatus Acidiferrales bacterium]